MKLYGINLPTDDMKMVINLLMDDLTELCLEGDDIVIRSAVIDSYRKRINKASQTKRLYISFELTDEQALLLMQTLFIYSKRMAEAGDERQYPLFDFAVQLFTPLTGKCDKDF